MSQVILLCSADSNNNPLPIGTCFEAEGFFLANNKGCLFMVGERSNNGYIRQRVATHRATSVAVFGLRDNDYGFVYCFYRR